ncbi:carbohydrate ABC transporter permease [Anaerolineales bacterium]
MNLKLEKVIVSILFYAMVILIFVVTVFPFYWALNSSFKTESEIINPATYIPKDPTSINYEAVFSNPEFMVGMKNSAIVSSISVVLALVVGSFAAYALGRIRFRGRTALLYLVLAMTMFPTISILSGLWAIVNELGLYNTIGSLILTYPIFTLPFTAWVLVSFFKGLPDELEQAALVDGASPFQTFRLILLPLTAPALVTTGLLAFINAWNEYLLARNFTILNPDARTVPVAIANFSGTISRQEPIAEVMAAAVVVTVPLIILVLIFQKRIVSGLTAGAVKG